MGPLSVHPGRNLTAAYPGQLVHPGQGACAPPPLPICLSLQYQDTRTGKSQQLQLEDNIAVPIFVDQSLETRVEWYKPRRLAFTLEMTPSRDTIYRTLVLGDDGVT